MTFDILILIVQSLFRSLIPKITAFDNSILQGLLTSTIIFEVVKHHSTISSPFN